MTTSAGYFIALCWGSIPAGPEQGGPPWLFVAAEHADHYVQQLRGANIPAERRGWDARVTEWRGQSLVCHPPIPRPELSGIHSGSPDDTNKGIMGEISDDTGGGNHADAPPPPPPTIEVT